MLTDAQIDRWSRQVLLPEVGGRGQARLLAARVRVAGEGPTAAIAADLLQRAGVATTDDAAAADVVVDLDGAGVDAAVPVVRVRRRGAAAVVTTLVGAPCAACAPDAPLPDGVDDALLAVPAARVAAALAAGEALVALLAPRPAGRRHVVDLAAGSCTAAAVAVTDGCARCRTPR